MAKKLRCYVRRHRWVMETTEGTPYAVCRDCSETDWDRYENWKTGWVWSRRNDGQADRETR